MTTIRTAGDARTLARGAEPLVASPPTFDGTLAAFTQRYILPNLPAPEIVTAFHRALEEYVAQPDALFLLRAVAGTDRRSVYETQDGTRFRATDNAPAWWTHAALARGHQIAPGAFGGVVATMPAHLFDVAAVSAPPASAAGWHIAHLFAVKDGATDYRGWSRADVVRRFVRNIHPCNYCLLAKPDWQRWGAEPAVLGYFAALYAVRYADVWRQFVALAGANPAALPRLDGPVPYAYPSSGPRTQDGGPSGSDIRSGVSGDFGLPNGTPVEYRASRLTFKRDVIELLTDEEAFRVTTPAGVFEMTKAAFCRAFPRVRASRSYREGGVYSYPTVPAAAEPFRVPAPT